MRLFCFPYAGGAASVYAPWLDRFESSVELVFIQLPGRANRFSEPPHVCIRSLIAELMQLQLLLHQNHMLCLAIVWVQELRLS